MHVHTLTLTPQSSRQGLRSPIWEAGKPCKDPVLTARESEGKMQG